MPELPEIEHLRRSLAPHLVGATVGEVRLRRADVVRAGDRRRRGRPRRLLAGATIARLGRRGKQLAIVAEDGRALVVHLGMSGQLLLVPPGGRLPRPDHVHCIWRLGAGGRLAFRDPRRFGGLHPCASPEALAARWARLGPDALGVTARELAPRLGRTRRAVKAALLDQSLVAGIGNIYADEALHRARLHPLTPAADLRPPAVRDLAAAVRLILRRAIEAGGSTLRDYVDASGRAGAYADAHLVYGRAGAPCRGCGRSLGALRVAQRTTVCCARCQPAPSPSRAHLVHDVHATAPRRRALRPFS